MKSIWLFAFFAVSLAAVRPAHSLADELDDLLYGEPSSAQQPTQAIGTQAEGQPTLDLMGNDATSYSDQSRWRPVVNTPAPRVSVAKTTATPANPAANSKSTETLPPNPVPEPSAVILGSLALLYFLIFGRRRRLA